MPKIRIYLEKQIIKDEKIFLDFNQIHYLKNVMRKKSGEKVFVFNEHSEWECQLNLNKENSLTPITFVRYEYKIPDIWICFGLIKLKNINNLIEKTSEIGVKKIIPLFTEFSSRISINNNRLKKISIEAIEQSNSFFLPEICETQTLNKLLMNWDKNRTILLCNEKGGSPIIKLKMLFKTFKKIAIFIGPVGGWSTSDIELFKDQKIFQISLGENILKADTAAIYSLSCVRALME